MSVGPSHAALSGVATCSRRGPGQGAEDPSSSTRTCGLSEQAPSHLETLEVVPILSLGTVPFILPTQGVCLLEFLLSLSLSLHPRLRLEIILEPSVSLTDQL